MSRFCAFYPRHYEEIAPPVMPKIGYVLQQKRTLYRKMPQKRVKHGETVQKRTKRHKK